MFTTSKGVPLSPVLQLIAQTATSCGIETKPLALGLRLLSTDAVLADCWYGVYLCKSSTRGLNRFEHQGAKLRPADKGQWCASVERYSVDSAEQRKQALALVETCVKAGYVALIPVAEKLASDKPALADTKAKKAKPRANKIDEAIKAL
jgi:hypothetical protein